MTFPPLELKENTTDKERNCHNPTYTTVGEKFTGSRNTTEHHYEDLGKGLESFPDKD